MPIPPPSQPNNQIPEKLLDEQFLHPDRHNQEALRQIGYAFVDLIVDGVLANQDQAFVKDNSSLDLNIGATGENWQDLLLEVRSQILPRALNLHNPGYMGHMDSVPLAITIWADALIAALNNNMLSEELAPVFTQLEAQLVKWFAQLFGFGSDCFGTLTAGGSLANITALLLARNHHQPQYIFQGVENVGGTHPAGNRRLVALISDAAHTSFDKAMNVVGLGRERLIKVATNARGEMDVTALEASIENAIAQGRIPFFIGAIAGTTITGAVDNLPAVAAIAQKYGCWFHIDAAYGGAAILSPQWRHLLKGTELADSITFNPQKWMWVARTCAMLLVKQKQHLIDGFDAHLPYMTNNSLNFGNLNLQGTRRTDSLKLWLALRALGTSGFAQLIDRSMQQTSALRAWVEQSDRIELVCEPTVNIICLRSTNPQVDSATLRQKWIEQGQLWLSLPIWQGDRILKAVVLHPYVKWPV
ncbi:MAG: glutamate decarboxylase [Pseudanabaena sp. RU_4_16]|nr:glutamate decarboxylase [Pseudanabaena sp. SU_2_4]NJM28691.1 glutamate decarboxylase [Pseudanabaena sp. RU_4_16]NKB17466.1 glutamate decarboxylase [Pseudanabaena sp. CRU_2_10]